MENIIVHPLSPLGKEYPDGSTIETSSGKMIIIHTKNITK